MKAFETFQGMDTTFWALVKFASENLGYTKRGKAQVKSYKYDEVKKLCNDNDIRIPDEQIQKVCDYSRERANILNNYVEKMLMTGDEAHQAFLNCEEVYRNGCFQCKIPMNKQRGSMKQIAYFTAMINILAEKTIRETTGLEQIGFDDDPRGLVYLWNRKGCLTGASSRRFDGAFPSIRNPLMVWEIKEYYYATTFGSRVADGVYETQLDGYEFNEIYNRTGTKVYHVLFIDAYGTWWKKGKSYLCRIIDILNSGIVDEVIVGREIFTRWPELIKEIIQNQDRVVSQFDSIEYED